MLRVLAILVNLGLLGAVIYEFYDNGLPKAGSDTFWFAVLLVGVPILNLSQILTKASPTADENILALWLRVKKTELRKRLE